MVSSNVLSSKLLIFFNIPNGATDLGDAPSDQWLGKDKCIFNTGKYSFDLQM